MLTPGRNCWRAERARRVAFIVDAAAYFAAFRAAAARARRSILIIGWDIDSRIRLVPEGAQDGLPETLGEFLDALARRSGGPDIYVLDWDFAMLYATGREILPIYHLGWRTHRRLRFHLDDAHPVGGSHHQKIVVVDDAVAFVGGLDLTHCRWDTPEHRPNDPRRRHPDGDPCSPFHDLQMAVDGAAAAALGELARERWRRATGEEIARGGRDPAHDPWPPGLDPDLSDVEVAIARTEPAYEEYAEVQEIKQLYLDAVAAAQRGIYIENQYFTASAVGEALARRLDEADGPEVLLVSRRSDSGWLEESTMGVLRARMHQRLTQADRHGRYQCLYPHLPGPDEVFLNVHSKLLIVDDELLTIGSANLCNRSMGFDTECNLAIEARGDARVGEAIAALRQRLLAEHLGSEPVRVAAKEQETGRLLATVRALEGGERTLKALNPVIDEDMEEWLPDREMIDPERPVDPERLVSEFVPREETASGVKRIIAFGALLALLLGLAAAWRWTPLGDWLQWETLVSAAEALRQSSAGTLGVLGIYVLAGFLVVPVTLLVALTVLVFGPWLGLALALSGSLLSAGATYVLGRALGRDTVRRLGGTGINRLSRRLGERGLLAMMAVRLIPVAPFTVVNLVAGASHIGARDFFLGTALGMAPGIVATVLFIDRVVAAMREPGAGAFAILAAVVALVIAGAMLLRRWLQRSESASRDA